MRVGPYRLHWLHDSLFKRFLKTKEPDAENLAKIWQVCKGMLDRSAKHLRTIAALLSANHPGMDCETQELSHLIRYQTDIEAVSHAKCSCRTVA
jgi:hypothetical protein